MWLEILIIVLSFLFLLQIMFSKTKTDQSISNSSLPDIKNKIPGMKATDPIEGNRLEMKKAKTKSSFIRQLHDKYGPIASFWDGKKYCVSIASPELFKQVRHIAETPRELFQEFEVLSGSSAISYCPIDEIKRRRKIYDKHFTMTACRSFTELFIEISKTMSEKWRNLPKGTPISPFYYMTRCALEALLRSSFGDHFKEEANFTPFITMMHYIAVRIDPPLEEGTEEHQALVQMCNKTKGAIKMLIESRRKIIAAGKKDEHLFIDVLLEEEFTEEERVADAALVIAAGYFTTAVRMTWLLYELARNPSIQEKIYKELVSTVGDSELSLDIINQLTYLRQAVDEILRLTLEPLYTARIPDEDMKLGGYDIAKGTVIYVALGYLLTDSKVWPNHKKFDPDRFSEENSKTRHSYAFKPFGYAGKRGCPGQVFAYTEMIAFFAEWVRKFRFELASEDKVCLNDDIIMMPNKEIMITVHQRP